MTSAPHPMIWLIQGETATRAPWADALRGDGMDVREFDGLCAALNMLAGRDPPAVLVADPRAGPLTAMELVEHVRDVAPQVQVVLTLPDGPLGGPAPQGVPILVQPFEGLKLSRCIRLVAAGPASRSPLQAGSSAARQGAAEEAFA